MNPPRIVAIVGATATGKTELGEALAAAIGGEVVCADARQVFRELEIGTGKPTSRQRAALPHHLFDALALGEHASAGGWAERARDACAAIGARGRTPVLVGGSGMYLASLMRGLHDAPPHDPPTRARLETEALERGIAALHARLAALDPATARRLPARDHQRIVRALEVAEVSGRPLSWWHAQEARDALAADWRVLEVTCPPRALLPRIAQRTRAMFAGGLVEETRALLARGLAAPLSALHAIGYDEAAALLAGTLDTAAAEERTNLRTRQLAKRQRTWFRHQVAAVRLDLHALEPQSVLAAARAALTV